MITYRRIQWDPQPDIICTRCTQIHGAEAKLLTNKQQWLMAILSLNIHVASKTTGLKNSEIEKHNNDVSTCSQLAVFAASGQDIKKPEKYMVELGRSHVLLGSL